MGDLISRAAAIAQIDKCITLSGIGLEPVMAIRDVKALISVLPAIDAIPVEWLRNLCATAKMETDDEMFVDWLIQTWHEEQEAYNNG